MRRQGAGIRRQQEGHRAGHRRPDGREGRQRGRRNDPRDHYHRGPRKVQEDDHHQGLHPHLGRHGRLQGDRGQGRAHQVQHRNDQVRVREGEAPGAPRQDRRRRSRNQGRRSFRGRGQRGQGPRRRRPQRHPRRRLRGHSPRRRKGPPLRRHQARPRQGIHGEHGPEDRRGDHRACPAGPHLPDRRERGRRGRGRVRGAGQGGRGRRDGVRRSER
mmetsp:Transcript_18289/g.33999  ORF Transcript_18289/g.33999 Transcript_18289/m.33999 type:complete len:215 (-) Transcript_18289:284-928(-)